MHKKGITEEVAKKRTRRAVKHQRAIVGASWEAIKAKRNQKPELAQVASRGSKISKQQARGAQQKVSAKSR
ncbi:7055_t:CDS:2 [Funneliformis caledonium]|uniref:7055_t:CDS:1 n=1 Tax=Funneliformis caledonium TaxID=1117310 RepID=A0A9N9G9D5_9GLOM|nr:7055_t:CDS:2 [Funneliformis caledonium]